MLGIHKYEAFRNAAFINTLLDIGSDVDKGPPGGDIEPDFFAVGFHGNLRLWIGRDAIRTC